MMAGDVGPIGRMMLGAAEAHWDRIARGAETADLAGLRRQRGRARRLKRLIDRFLHVADGRLAADTEVAQGFARPPGTDWAWRPEIWRGPVAEPGVAGARPQSRIGSEITLFHDCDLAEITLRQVRSSDEDAWAPFALRLDVFSFEGSYLSLALDLPEQAAQGLRRRHVVRADLTVQVESPIEVFTRLNIRHGPNTEQIVRELPELNAPTTVEFDLAYSRLNEKRVERMWLDLIFERPEMNRVILGDLVLTRRPRADL